MRRKSLAVLASIISVASVMVGTGSAGAVTDTARHNVLTQAQSDEIARYGQDYPLDLVGLARLVKKYTGEEMPVQMNGIDHPLTAAEAQKVMEYRDRMTGPFAINEVPVDAFSVVVAWYPEVGPPPRKVAHGVFNFRDDYVNGSEPDDFSALAIQLGCSRIRYSTGQAAKWNGQDSTRFVFLQDSGLLSSAPIFGYDDGVSSFELNVDNGAVDVHIENAGQCGKHDVGAAFSYEHNQDGGSVLSVSFSVGKLSIAYNNVGAKLQHATNPVYTSIG